MKLAVWLTERLGAAMQLLILVGLIGCAVLATGPMCAIYGIEPPPLAVTVLGAVMAVVGWLALLVSAAAFTAQDAARRQRE